MELSLESLGLTQDELADRVVDASANRLLSREVRELDEDGSECEFTETSSLGKKLKQMIQQRIDAAVAAMVDQHILPNVQQYIEKITLQKTNQWGEAKGESLTFIEYLTERAESYMTEKVDFSGKSKAEDRSYSSWKGTQTRITHMIERHLHRSIETAMKAALESGLSTIVKGVQETAQLKLAEIAKTLKVSTNLKT